MRKHIVSCDIPRNIEKVAVRVPEDLVSPKAKDFQSSDMFNTVISFFKQYCHNLENAKTVSKKFIQAARVLNKSPVYLLDLLERITVSDEYFFGDLVTEEGDFILMEDSNVNIVTERGGDIRPIFGVREAIFIDQLAPFAAIVMGIEDE